MAATQLQTGGTFDAGVEALNKQEQGDAGKLDAFIEVACLTSRTCGPDSIWPSVPVNPCATLSLHVPAQASKQRLALLQAELGEASGEVKGPSQGQLVSNLSIYTC